MIEYDSSASITSSYLSRVFIYSLFSATQSRLGQTAQTKTYSIGNTRILGQPYAFLSHPNLEYILIRVFLGSLRVAIHCHSWNTIVYKKFSLLHTIHLFPLFSQGNLGILEINSKSINCNIKYL